MLRYTFKTNEYLKDCAMPIVLFHDDNDGVIYYGFSVKLKQEFKSCDTLITLHQWEHNGITDNPEYIKAISKIPD